MSANTDTKCVTTANKNVDDAVGLDFRKWFVAIVNNKSEKKVQENLSKLNYESFVATQLVYRIWKNGRRAKVDKVILPSLVFVKCTEQERKEIVALPYINRFMMNRARVVNESSLAKPLAVIPQKQIDTLRFMLGQSNTPIEFSETPYKVNDKIRIIRGDLKGLEGEVIKTHDGKSELIVRVDMLGCAKLTVDAIDIELIK